MIASYGAIGGGGPSNPLGDPAGTNNRVFDDYGTIGGGGRNRVGIDDGNTTIQIYSTVGGGLNNAATGAGSTVGGGFQNIATGIQNATVGGGFNNIASGTYSTLGGGFFNITASASSPTTTARAWSKWEATGGSGRSCCRSTSCSTCSVGRGPGSSSGAAAPALRRSAMARSAGTSTARRCSSDDH